MSFKTTALNEKLGHMDLLPSVTVDEAAPYREVLKLMREMNRGSIVVCKGGKASGIFTERDILNRCILEDVPPGTPIGKLMTPKPAVLSSETTLGEAVELMHSKGVRNLPLVDAKGRPGAILTVGRVIRYLADHFPAEVINLPPEPHKVSDASEGA